MRLWAALLGSALVAAPGTLGQDIPLVDGVQACSCGLCRGLRDRLYTGGMALHGQDWHCVSNDSDVESSCAQQGVSADWVIQTGVEVQIARFCIFTCKPYFSTNMTVSCTALSADEVRAAQSPTGNGRLATYRYDAGVNTSQNASAARPSGPRHVREFFAAQRQRWDAARELASRDADGGAPPCACSCGTSLVGTDSNVHESAARLLRGGMASPQGLTSLPRAEAPPSPPHGWLRSTSTSAAATMQSVDRVRTPSASLLTLGTARAQTSHMTGALGSASSDTTAVSCACPCASQAVVAADTVRH